MGARPPVTLRDATIDDAEKLIRLWAACAAAAGDEHSDTFSQQLLWREPTCEEAAEALAFNFARRGRRIIVAVDEHEQVVGAVVGDLGTLTPISGSRILIVTDIQVAPEFRRKSIATVLLSAMAAHAEEQGCEITLASVPVHARESNRYLAKLGFNQIAVLRATQTSRLRARLDGKVAYSKVTGRLLAVRRTLRRRVGSPVG
ncbi:GNAT family N-acetyltransferase [Aeromicrobium phragmitis]|uniref:GNAT family N-acetyltransferase n=1 Tax=Aeromicrobium phragmitis TaxID=2478914 RepID=A0A3L8PMG8_9ACTN|nr:GNAT family N-acetyltransferase [Aeromicrobium phragmitis]RLV55222.1 GNAT family N-acetyltransferase [Aeromicrobium phragmitis]